MSSPFRRGFTVTELFVVLAIIGILALLLIPVISTTKSRAQRVQCMSNLRSLYTATELYIQQNGNWPQISMSDADSAEQDYANAWIAALTQFGLTQKNWICPTIQDLLNNPDLSNPENTRVDYMGMNFDNKPTTPHQWPHQPWFIESADVHGNGNLIIFTDGSISDLNTAKSSTGQ